MTLLSRLTGAILMIGSVVWLCMSSGDAGIFIDATTIIFVVVIVAGGLLVACDPHDIRLAIVEAITGRPASSPQALARELAAMHYGYNLAWAAGIVGTVLGLIVILRHMNDPTKIGPGMAVGLLCALYGALLAEFGFNVVAQSLKTINSNQETAALPGGPRGSLGLAAFVILIAIVLFYVLVLANLA